MRGWRRGAAVSVLVLAAGAARLEAQTIILDKDEERVFRELNWIPYAFFTESFGLGAGVGAAYSGWPTEAAAVMGAATAGTKGSYNVVVALSDYQMPGLPRLVLEPMLLYASYEDQRVYVGRNPEFPGERAGSNGSDEGNYYEVTQGDDWVRLPLHCLLPIGDGRETIVHRYVIDRGLLVQNPSGGDVWNPLVSGRTRLTLVPEWREQDLRGANDRNLPVRTMNVRLALEYDNRDFPFNATRGSLQRLSYQRDFDDDEMFGEWESWSFRFAKIFDLGVTRTFRQRVLALGFWTAYVPTWETKRVDGEEVVVRRPPYYAGGRLGGLYRMRAFEDNRWQDRAAIYYSAELRVIPEWQPLRDVDWLRWAAIEYWQWVLFAEAGQVAPSYALSALHDDLRYDGGIGLRGMIHKAVCRLDVAFGEEGARVVAMYGQPF